MENPSKIHGINELTRHFPLRKMCQSEATRSWDSAKQTLDSDKRQHIESHCPFFVHIYTPLIMVSSKCWFLKTQSFFFKKKTKSHRNVPKKKVSMDCWSIPPSASNGPTHDIPRIFPLIFKVHVLLIFELPSPYFCLKKRKNNIVQHVHG